eukprot:Clim_evm3s245 gene=Clim_evmTU3s245
MESIRLKDAVEKASDVKPLERAEHRPSFSSINSVGMRQRIEISSSEETRGVAEEFRMVERRSSADNEGRECRIDTSDGYPPVLACACFVFVVGALSYNWGIFLPRIVDDLDSSLALSAWPGALALTTRAAAAPWSGAWPSRYGTRRVVAAGAVLILIGLLIGSYATEIWHFYIAYGLFLGVGLSMLIYPATSIVIQWYDKKKATMLSWGMASVGFGGLVGNVAAAEMIEHFGWRNALRIFMSLVVVFVGIGLCLAHDRVKPTRVKIHLEWYLFKDVRFSLVFLCNVFFAFGYAAPFFFTATWAERHNLSSTVGAMATGLITLATSIGQLGIGWLQDRLSREFVFVVCMLCAGASLMVYPICTNEWSLMLVCVLYGLFTGGQQPNTAAIITDWYPKHNPGTTTGLSGAGRAVGELVGPVVVALLFDTNAESAFMLSGAFMMLCGICVLVGTVWPKLVANYYN